MKKKLFLLPILMFALTACGSNNTCNACNNSGNENRTVDIATNDSPRETDQLSVGNFSKYVAVNTTAAVISNTANSVIFYSYFIGADYCKFINCTVTYTYVVGNNEPSSNSGQTVPLTLSGDGQAEPFHVSLSSANVYYRIVVLNASGTVEVYR